MYNKRENNYDLLRVVSVTAVISIHVSMKYLHAVGSVAWLINILARFAVPCLIMLSGAFLLSNDMNLQYKYFYKKIIKNIGIHTINFSILYFLFSEIISISAKEGVIEPIFQWMAGRPFYHMWYLYMMIGVYLLVPILMHLKKEVGATFDKIVIVFFPFAVLSIWTSQYELDWNLGNSFCYLSYFTMGYVIRKNIRNKKNNVKGCFCLICGVLIEVLIFYLQQYCILNFRYIIYSPCSPFVAVASLFIFAGFSFLDIKNTFEKIASLSIYIYLFHAGIWEVFYKVERIILENVNYSVILPVLIVNIAIVFILSTITSAVYKSIWTIVDKKFEISYRLIKFIK